MPERRLLYIMGRGHSGSTVLDALLDNCENVQGVGELISGLSRFEHGACSCGVPITECDFWNQVRNCYPVDAKLTWAEASRLQVGSAHIRKYLRTMTASATDSWVNESVAAMNNLVNAIGQASNTECILDSSKEQTRGLFLARFFPNVRVIHLVRHPSGVLHSYRNRFRKGGSFSFLRHKYKQIPGPLFPVVAAIVVLSWALGVIMAQVTKLMAPGRVLTVRFEDLCTDPGEELQRIARFVEIDATSLVQRISEQAEFSLGHKIGGNQILHQSSFRFRSEVGNKHRLLSWPLQIWVRLLAWPAMLWHRYQVFGR